MGGDKEDETGVQEDLYYTVLGKGTVFGLRSGIPNLGQVRRSNTWA